MKTYVAEEPRRAAFSTALSQGGILPTYPVAGGIGTVHTDGDLRVKCLDALPLYYIQEIKLDLSTGGAEPFTEAVFYYDCGIRDMYENKSFVFSKEVRRKMNFPAVLVLHVGPYLCVAAAVFTDRPIVEHLASVPLHAHSTNVEEHDRGRRVLAALRKAVNSLQERYPDIHDKRGPDAEYPFRDFYEDSEKNKHYFTYLTSIEDKRVFRAKLVTQGSDEGEHGQPVIVKFSTRYSEDAHRAAHKIGLAPKLYAVNDVYGWQMVVMEDESADWTTLYDLMRYKRHGDWIQWVGAEVEAKLSLLHQQGFVHGDVRDVNMLLRRNMDQDDDPRKILLVDWDWAGTIHNASYPPNINRTDIARPAGARAGARITPAHDLWMAERLCTG
ncbi:hypothetical protein OE88DRAFT_1633093 [Heliocybe sulcata]|uniref:Protein kinase domain-containing protein n=1 Tax=Heliocybe sulcata TaxID=5364 RepID=A0A5C3MVS1_9AGAM|nr:hypothetical protein OE88DRAFT_1633093 [Heliocybe sulcata]